MDFDPGANVAGVVLFRGPDTARKLPLFEPYWRFPTGQVSVSVPQEAPTSPQAKSAA